MYNSLAKIDLVAETPEGRIAVQTDHRTAAEIEAAWSLSVVFAASRVISAQNSGQVKLVRCAHLETPPPALVTLMQQLGAEVECGMGNTPLPPAPDRAAAAGTIEAAFLTLGRARMDKQQLPITIPGLDCLEITLRGEDIGDDEDSEAYWTAIVELAGAAALVMKTLHGGKIHLETEPGVLPFRWDVDGSLTNLFGRARSYLTDDETVAPSRLVAMTAEVKAAGEDGDVMFNLRPPDWPGVKLALTFPLLTHTDKLSGPALPIVALVIDMPTSTKTIPIDTPPEKVAALRAEALINVRKQPLETVDIGEGSSRIIVTTGSFYAAERLLDPEYMRGLEQKLDAKLLLAGTPSKGILMVQSALQSPGAGAGFMNVIAGQYDRAAPNDRLSKAVLLVQDGQIVGVAAASEEKPPPPKKWFWQRWFGGDDN